MLEVLFLACGAIIFYIYAGYAVIVYFISRITGEKLPELNAYPDISIIISAYNEEQEIGETIRNKLQQDYPSDKMEIIVVSDGSDDNTDLIVKDFASSGVKLVRQSPRQGKTAAVNRAVKAASGEILIFSDANSRWREDAVRKLIQKFANPRVGYITGKMVYINPDGSLIGDGCSAYMKYENVIRESESRFASVIGVDGGIDAVRKELYIPMSPDQLPDFVLPLNVIEQGYRVAYEPEAVLNETALSDQGAEFRMRIRVTLRALWALYDKRNLLNPLRYPLTSWQLISHKLLRYSAWIPLTGCLVLNPLLLDKGSFYGVILTMQVIFYMLAFIGYRQRNEVQAPFVFYAPYYFLVLNTAAAMAFIRFVKGEKQILWQPRSG